MCAKSKPIYEQSAVIALRRYKGDLQCLLISNRKGKRWVLPKGLIEPDLTPQESAAKEAQEEAGIVGNVLPDCIGTYEYEKWGGVCRVQVFLMELSEHLDDFEEKGLRKQLWVSPEDASNLVNESELSHILMLVPELYEQIKPDGSPQQSD